MSLGIYPVFEPELAATEFDALGEALAHNFELLDQIARTAKLKPFTAFADKRSIPEDFNGDPDELEEIMGEWTEWFEPAEGRAAMQALADHIRTNPKVLRKVDEAAWVVEELEEMVRVLAVAETEGVRFRLEMS
jgi:hypothetical protein